MSLRPFDTSLACFQCFQMENRGTKWQKANIWSELNRLWCIIRRAVKTEQETELNETKQVDFTSYTICTGTVDYQVEYITLQGE